MNKTLKGILSIISAVAVMAAVAGCAPATGTTSSAGASSATSSGASSMASSDTASSSDAPAPITKDRAGMDITLPKEINSIISLAPSSTEVLYALGMKDKIIAIDTQSQRLEGINTELPAFDMMSPDGEKMASLKPDIVFVSGMSFAGDVDPFKALKDMGICIVQTPSSDSIKGITEDISFIAQVVGKQAEGEKIVADMQTEVDRIAAIGKTITDKKSVLFEIACAPDIYSFGSGVFLNEMIEIIGATNVLADQKSWLAVEVESAVKANPDVILTNVTYVEDPVAEILSREGFAGVTAVKEKQVYYIDNFASSLPNHNIVKALNQMAKAIYPEQYK